MCFPGEMTAMPLTSLAMLLQVWIETCLWSHLQSGFIKRGRKDICGWQRDKEATLERYILGPG